MDKLLWERALHKCKTLLLLKVQILLCSQGCSVSPALRPELDSGRHESGARLRHVPHHDLLESQVSPQVRHLDLLESLVSPHHDLLESQVSPQVHHLDLPESQVSPPSWLAGVTTKSSSPPSWLAGVTNKSPSWLTGVTDKSPIATCWSHN